MRPRPRQAIERMSPYAPPTGSRHGLQRLDFNENTVGPSPKVVEKLREIATQDFLATYPEYEQARARMGEFFGVGADQVMFSDGTDEAIHILVQTYVEHGDEALIPSPSFPMYRFYVQAAGADPVDVEYRRPSLSFPSAELLARIGPRTKAILIANPNNPTGGAIGLAEIERILEGAPGAAVLIDEAYFEFYGVTAIPMIAKYPNLFVSRTFSKAYGLAGLRVGCMLSQPENTAALRRGQSPYSVNSLAIACALAAIEDQQYVRSYVAEALEARADLIAALDQIEVPHWPSEANFVLADFGDGAERVCSVCRERGILVRDRGKEIAGSVRLTVGTKRQTAQLIEALREAVCGS
jgi:histidinol-phosphate aminotransferase